MVDLAVSVKRVIQAAGVAVTDVSIGDSANKGTWRVHPVHLQSAAQPHIDAFDPNDPAHEQAELDTQVKAQLDRERVFSALVWAILDTYSAPATVTKYNAARTKIIAAYKTKPWAG